MLPVLGAVLLALGAGTREFGHLDSCDLGQTGESKSESEAKA